MSWSYEMMAARIKASRNGQPKVMNNTTIRYDGDAIVVRHFNTDLFKTMPNGDREIICAYDSVTSRRRFWELGGIPVYRVMRNRHVIGIGMGLAWRELGYEPDSLGGYPSHVPVPFENYTPFPSAAAARAKLVLAAASHWLATLNMRRGTTLRSRCEAHIDHWETADNSGKCLVDQKTGCYVRLVTRADVQLYGVDIAAETATVDGVTYYIEDAQDYARGGRL